MYAEAKMPSPLAALMGIADGAMGLLQKVFNQGSSRDGFEAQLTAALQSDSTEDAPLLQKLLTDQGSVDENLLASLAGNTQAIPVLQYLTALKSMGLTAEDVKALLLGNGEGLSDEGLKTLLASCGVADTDIAQLMADTEGLAGLKANLAEALSTKLKGQLADTGLNVDQLIEQTTVDQDTFDAMVTLFALSKGVPQTTVQSGETAAQQLKTTPADIEKINAGIRESLTAVLNGSGMETSTTAAAAVFAEIMQTGSTTGVTSDAVSEAGSGAVAQVTEVMDTLENTFNIPKKTVQDLLFSTDPTVRQAAVDEATARVSEFLDANTGRELTKQETTALGMLKGSLSRQEFAKISDMLQSSHPDQSATVQSFTFTKASLDALAQGMGEEAAGKTGRYTQDVLDQIRQAVPTGVKGNEGSVSLKLNPPMLGRVDIDIRMEDGQILASFKVDQPVTRDILQQNMHVLKEALSEQGIKATQFVVTTDTFTSRDHREAYAAWAGYDRGHGGSSRGGKEQGTGRSYSEQGAYARVPEQGYSETSGLDIFA